MDRRERTRHRARDTGGERHAVLARARVGRVARASPVGEVEDQGVAPGLEAKRTSDPRLDGEQLVNPRDVRVRHPREGVQLEAQARGLDPGDELESFSGRGPPRGRAPARPDRSTPGRAPGACSYRPARSAAPVNAVGVFSTSVVTVHP